MSEEITKAQPAVPVVSDEQIRTTVESIQDPDTVHAFHNGYYTLTPDELRRAILAMRPAVEPMTDDVHRSYQCMLAMNTPHGFGDRIGPFVKWLQDSGITAKAEDANQPTKEVEKAP